MALRNKTRSSTRSDGKSRSANVYGGRIFTPNIRASRFAGAGAQMAARGARDASKALDTYIKDKRIEDAQAGVATAFKNDALPEGASREMVEAFYGTRGQNDGHQMQSVLTDYLIENPDVTFEEYSTYAKAQFDGYIKDKPDAYAIGYGSKAIPILEENLRAFKVREETQKREDFLTDTLVKFKDDVKLLQRQSGEKTPEGMRKLITDMQTSLKEWGFDRTDIGKEAVRVIEAQALESEDLSLFEVFEMKDQDGIRLIDNSTLGKAILAAEENVQRRIDASKREEKQALIEERQENWNSIAELVVQRRWNEVLGKSRDLTFALDPNQRMHINDLVQTEISQNRALTDTSRIDKRLNQEILMQVASGELDELTIPEIKELRRQGKIDMNTAIKALSALGSDAEEDHQKKFWKQTEVVQLMNPAGMDTLLLNPSVDDQFSSNKSYNCKDLYQDDVRSWVIQYNAEHDQMPSTDELRDYAGKREAYWQSVGFNSAADTSVVKEFYKKIVSYNSEGKPAPGELLRGFGTFFNNPDMTNEEFLDFREEMVGFHQNMEEYTPEPESESEPKAETPDDGSQKKIDEKSNSEAADNQETKAFPTPSEIYSTIPLKGPATILMPTEEDVQRNSRFKEMIKANPFYQKIASGELQKEWEKRRENDRKHSRDLPR